ncbi:alpha/beta hydrolase [Nonomuraea sp. WAC 01424]|uniref:alpha/beta hydrolase n=1 Tax=Nonomuraea sp. WAC 01424 TaxID=2203200 RepID=UPI001C8B48DF|nr:alpha/beta hydrolase [Nonomuraea sp. WAC 01424]
MRVRKIATAVATGATLLAGMAVTGQASASVTGDAGADARFHRQTIDWHGCRTGPDDETGAALDKAGAQCAEVTVPLDYRRPRGRTISVAISRVKATDPGRRRGVLLINPGGPGGSGLPRVLLGRLMPAVAARYDLIGMDPRFVGRSTPIRCRWTTDTPTRSAGPTRRTFDESVALMRELAAGCARGDRALLPYASTRNTARDMDVIRAALGESRLSYLGYSYGTYLGAVYTQMFGARADRVVLDSAVDPDVYGPDLLSRNDPAITAALRHWASWAAARDKEYGLGATEAEVLATVEGVDRAAAERPLRVGAYRIGAQHVPYLLFIRLYDDREEAYAGLAAEVRVLADAARGDAVTVPASLKETLDGLFTGSGPAEDRAGTPILCADRATSRDPERYFRDIQAHRADEPLFGPMTRNLSPCAFWPVTPVEAPTTIGNHAPMLIVAADGDTVTPYAGQRAMHRALTGSRLVTLRGAFRHGAYLAAGDTCVDTTVGRYLVDGVLPGGDTTCDKAGAPRR